MANAVASCSAPRQHRSSLFDAYSSVLRADPSLTRALVSNQANRQTPYFSWFKYKEAFSASLVQTLLTKFHVGTDGLVLDPFAGSGTTLFVSRSAGVDSIGIELLPVCAHAIESRLAAETANPDTFRRHVARAAETRWECLATDDHRLRHIPITRGAFSPSTERAIAGFRAYVDQHIRHPGIQALFNLAGLSVLETVSYTRKDGQYLRWDYRARKPRVQSRFDKGPIPRFADAITSKLTEMSDDLSLDDGSPGPLWMGQGYDQPKGSVDLRLQSCLDELPSIPDESVSLVLTSPPYCNRYDYTRTYALELVYLGYDAEDVKRLRQAMVSCTVENRAKREALAHAYASAGQRRAFAEIERVFQREAALHEVLDYLDEQARAGCLNNANIPRMVRNYFFEMCFVVRELSRVLRKDGRVVMVNDNVRYRGEEVPVDLILSEFARAFGLEIEAILTLPRGKGNSSQQMGMHGRSELRKCIYIWRRP